MKFIKIEPRTGKEEKAHAKKIIRVLFTKVKGKEASKPKEPSPSKEPKNEANEAKQEYSLTIYIGKELAEKLKINIGDKVSLSREEQNSRILLLEKVAVGAGYKVIKVGKVDNICKIMLRWQFFIPQESDFKTREVKHEFYENGILIRM